MDDKRIFVTDESGDEVEFEVVLTFNGPENGKKYVVYKLPNDESEEVFAAVYDETNDGGGTLIEIDNEEEFDMVQEVLDAFLDEEE